MDKKTFAIIVEIIPVISAVVNYPLILSGADTAMVRGVIGFTTLFAFLGFLFFFMGRKLAKEEKIVRVLGILDWVATLSVILIYVVAIFSFGV